MLRISKLASFFSKSQFVIALENLKDFDSLVIKSKKPVVVDFFATYSFFHLDGADHAKNSFPF